MKRNYVTPVIVMQSFGVAQSIGACAIKINSLDEACVLADDDSTPTMQGLAAAYLLFSSECINQAQGMNGEDGICYHTSANATFNS